MPTVPRGHYGDVEEYAVKLKFSLSKKGIVYSIEPVISSGYPTIDLRAASFIKKWRFSQATSDKEAECNWGIVSVGIKAK